MAHAAVDIVKEGWLQKRGEHIRNWRARYFILFDNGDLMGFKAQPERDNYRDPYNHFTVRDCQIMAVDRPRPYTFTVRGLQWTNVIERSFSVDSEREREEWMAAIQSVASQMSVDDENALSVAGASVPDGDDDDIAQLGTSGRDPRRVTLEKFELVKVLGRGTYGKVILTREKRTGRLYAMKILKKTHILRSSMLENAVTENHVLKNTRHPFLTALRYSFQTADRVCFVMEFANGGELFYHHTRARTFTEDRTRFYAAEIVSAIGYLHARGIIYRDLKLENLMLDKDGHIKLADFGICKENMSLGGTTHTQCGTPQYLAPEVISRAQYGRAVDWWGVGVVVYEMTTGRLPFDHPDQETLFNMIVNAPVRFPRSVSSECVSLVRGLLAKHATARLGAGPADAHDVMAHAFFADINWDHLVAKKIPPPFKPQVESESDTRYFEAEFTGAPVELTPPDRPAHAFPQLSYQVTHNKATTTLSNSTRQTEAAALAK